LAPPRKLNNGIKNVEKKKKKLSGKLKEIKTEKGFDADENVDFFWDLEDDIRKGWSLF
jgi:hypothetical protein